MSDGKSILFAGGLWPYGSLASAFVRDTSAGPGGIWTNMTTERSYFVGSLLWSAGPVVVGGWRTQSSSVLQTSEVYTP